MKEKNKKLIVIVGALLLVVGVSFAYFTSTGLTGGSGTKSKGTTAVINGANISVEGELDFSDTNIMPGHKVVSSIKVTANGDNALIPYNLVWNGTNSLNTPLNFTVYKTSSKLEVKATCKAKTKVVNGVQQLNEECAISNIEKLGSIISEGTIETSTTTKKVILAEEEFINASPTGEENYYYIILEYPNLDTDQSSDIGGSFNGSVTIEESNASPDINIIAAYIKGEDGTYKESKDIPQAGYMLNQEKSVCSNGAVPDWDYKNNTLLTKNLTKSGTSCYLYFEDICRNGEACKVILNGITPKPGSDSFTGIADTDEGVFSGTDDDGPTYYYRGAVTNNYLRFANKWWRIIRINGDGTIRIIYDGTAYHANGSSTTDSQIGTSKFNAKYNDNAYVGFMYGTARADTYEATHANTNKSAIVTSLETWYANNLAEYENQIDTDAGFCGDRGIIIGTGRYEVRTYYAPDERILSNEEYKLIQIPTFACKQENDLYTISKSSKGNKSLDKSIGLITTDEVVYAGGFGGKNNTSYYLYNGQNYWTMTPHHMNSSKEGYISVGGASNDYTVAINMFVNSNGNISKQAVSISNAVRPVINLRANVKLTGSGTGTDPFVVVGAE